MKRRGGEKRERERGKGEKKRRGKERRGILEQVNIDKY